MKQNKISNCEDCVFYDYDEDWECYVCTMNLDEDEMVRFLSGKTLPLVEAMEKAYDPSLKK